MYYDLFNKYNEYSGKNDSLEIIVFCLQNFKSADSVLLNLFMRINRKSYTQNGLNSTDFYLKACTNAAVQISSVSA